MSTLFISDLHLSARTPAVNRAFWTFLSERAIRAEALYILGDLVEAWLGDDDPDPLARELVSRLRALTDAGVQVRLIRGNRDFLMGKRFARETGARILPDYQVLETGSRRLLLCHGDTLCTDDRAYQRFRRLVQSPLGRGVLARLPLTRRQALAENWRRRSHQANRNKAENIMDVNPTTVRRIAARHEADILIHGHTHRPGIHDHDFGHRIVLGDWGDLGWFAELDSGEVELHSFPIDAAGGTG